MHSLLSHKDIVRHGTLKWLLGLYYVWQLLAAAKRQAFSKKHPYTEEETWEATRGDSYLKSVLHHDDPDSEMLDNDPYQATLLNQASL